MYDTVLKKQFKNFKTLLDTFDPEDWRDIARLLDDVKERAKSRHFGSKGEALNLFAKGTAFITFSYGIDGVSIEMAKYAKALNAVLGERAKPQIHFIGGDFLPQASTVLHADWHRLRLDGFNGWNKWDDGKWFSALYHKKMEPGSAESRRLTREVYRQAVDISKRLGDYFIDQGIFFAVSVNIASNPGNLAATLAFILVTEALGIYVLNSNHDYYWESGKPASERAPGEKPGFRDHFFTNIDNKQFFSLFEKCYPWNGERWIQVNINSKQSERLIGDFNFVKDKVFQISTSVADSFFELSSLDEIIDIRLRMGKILSDGQPTMIPVSVDKHLKRLDDWMKNQHPIILGARRGLSVDPKSSDLFILLQPTRIISRKRIERNLELIDALLKKSALKEEFENNINRQLILHITGPTPKEHQKDLENVLVAYNQAISTLPQNIADRIFISFSVGRQTHPTFQNKPLTIESIYQMADIVVFPSETEGRGLPIIEACAIGVPIVCSRYKPREVFGDLIGENLHEEMRIQFINFNEGSLQQELLDEVADLLLNPETGMNRIAHNRKVVRARFSETAIKNQLDQIINQLCKAV